MRRGSNNSFVGNRGGITIRKGVSALLSEGSLPAMIAAGTPDVMMYAKDRRGRYLFFNAAACRFVGHPATAVLGRTAAALFPAAEARRIRREEAALLRTGKTRISEEVLTCQGRPRTFLTTRGPLRDKRGRLIGLFSTSRDITERKQMETVLRESEAHYRLLAENMEDFVSVHNIQERRLYISPSYYRLTGWAPADLENSPWDARLHPDDLPLIKQARVANRAGRTTLIEHRLRCRDGRWLWVESRCKPIRDATGRVRQLVIWSHDITERKDTAAQLAEDLQAMTLLHEVSTLFAQASELQPVLDKIVGVAMTLARADMGNIQLLDPHGRLEIRAQRGFKRPWLAFWRHVRENAGACGAALKRQTRVVVTDITRSPLFVGTPALKVQLAAGVRAVISTPLTGPGGQLLGMLSVHFKQALRPSAHTLQRLDLLARLTADIISHAQAETALKASETRLNFALERSHTGGWDLDLTHHTTHRTLEHDRIFGYPKLLPKWTYEMFLKHVVPEDRGAVDRSFRAATAAQTDWSFECRIRRHDGAIRWIWAAGGHQRDATGQARRLAGIVQDITERKQAEAALRDSEHLLRHVIDLVPHHIFAKDRAGRYLFANRAVADFVRHTPQELVGRRELDFSFNKAQTRAFLRDDRAVIDSGQTKFIPEEAGTDAAGHQRWLQTTKRAFRPPGSTERAVLGVAIDITEQKRAAAALRELARRLFHAEDEERRRLARELHDSTAQRLAALVLNLDLLSAELGQAPPNVARLLANVHNLADQSAREVRNLSYLLHPPLLDQLGLASALRAYLEGFTQRSRVRVKLALSPDTLRLPGEIELALFRVVQEGLSNILRHSGSQTAGIRLQRQPRRIVLTVSDNGRGMEPGVAQALLTGRPMAGVGLAGMRERLQLLNGTLGIQTSPRGTTLRVTVPLPEDKT